jgi:tRNA nucleotidyltransferase (CCA-adding enzyme)
MRAMRTPAAALAQLPALPGGRAAAGLLAADPGAWLVGGAVRDLLLGRAPRELDIVLEDGDPTAVAAGLGEVEVEKGHERFGTATAITPDGGRVDLVRARREAYPRPGALPEVRPGTLDEDLARRDVSVNAIALRPGGERREVPGAGADLEAGVLRVLHPRSFEDDPTRLWRVGRYAARLGFAPDAETRRLAAAADPTTASGPRHGNELRKALAEPDPLAALAAARLLQPRLLPEGFSTEPPNLREALALLPPGEGDPRLVTLAACAGGVDLARLLAWLDALAFPAAERDIVAAGSRAAVLAPLRAAVTPAQIARAARGVPVELVALAGGEAAGRWLDELRHVRLDITGHDLLAAGVPPGPEVGERLGRALDARLDGTAPGRDEQLAVALG